MNASAAPIATLSQGSIVSLRLSDGEWAAAVASSPGEWQDVPGRFASEADAVRAASLLLRRATVRR